jgi:hypothetical protein
VACPRIGADSEDVVQALVDLDNLRRAAIGVHRLARRLARTIEPFGIVETDQTPADVTSSFLGMTVELVPHLFVTANNRPSGQRGLYCYWRVGADCVNTGAFGMLNVT